MIVTASDGVQLRGYSIHRPEARGTVVLVHGWGPNLATLDADAGISLSRGLTWRGWIYGAWGRRRYPLDVGFSEVGDLRSLFSHLRAEGRLPRPVVLSGISLGATIALLAAAEEPEVVGVIADSPFNRLEEAVDHYAARSLPIMPKYPMRWLTLRLVELQVGRRLSSLSVESVLPKLAPRPILLMHCEGDSLVLCRNSDQIAAAYPEHTEYWRIPGGDHLSARWQDPDEWERRVDAFLERVAPALRAP
ncbi:alpha/beta fold hydrolase [bacterium]|nr:alpha/beta fold hydrolase [bacterium]